MKRVLFRFLAAFLATSVAVDSAGAISLAIDPAVLRPAPLGCWNEQAINPPLLFPNPHSFADWTSIVFRRIPLDRAMRAPAAAAVVGILSSAASHAAVVATSLPSVPGKALALTLYLSRRDILVKQNDSPWGLFGPRWAQFSKPELFPGDIIAQAPDVVTISVPAPPSIPVTWVPDTLYGFIGEKLMLAWEFVQHNADNIHVLGTFFLIVVVSAFGIHGLRILWKEWKKARLPSLAPLWEPLIRVGTLMSQSPTFSVVTSLFAGLGGAWLLGRKYLGDGWLAEPLSAIPSPLLLGLSTAMIVSVLVLFRLFRTTDVERAAHEHAILSWKAGIPLWKIPILFLQKPAPSEIRHQRNPAHRFGEVIRQLPEWSAAFGTSRDARLPRVTFEETVLQSVNLPLWELTRAVVLRTWPLIGLPKFPWHWYWLPVRYPDDLKENPQGMIEKFLGWVWHHVATRLWFGLVRFIENPRGPIEKLPGWVWHSLVARPWQRFGAISQNWLKESVARFRDVISEGGLNLLSHMSFAVVDWKEHLQNQTTLQRIRRETRRRPLHAEWTAILNDRYYSKTPLQIQEIVGDFAGRLLNVWNDEGRPKTREWLTLIEQVVSTYEWIGKQYHRSPSEVEENPSERVYALYTDDEGLFRGPYFSLTPTPAFDAYMYPSEAEIARQEYRLTMWLLNHLVEFRGWVLLHVSSLWPALAVWLNRRADPMPTLGVPDADLAVETWQKEEDALRNTSFTSLQDLSDAFDALRQRFWILRAEFGQSNARDWRQRAYIVETYHAALHRQREYHFGKPALSSKEMQTWDLISVYRRTGQDGDTFALRRLSLDEIEAWATWRFVDGLENHLRNGGISLLRSLRGLFDFTGDVYGQYLAPTWKTATTALFWVNIGQGLLSLLAGIHLLGIPLIRSEYLTIAPASPESIARLLIQAVIGIALVTWSRQRFAAA